MRSVGDLDDLDSLLPSMMYFLVLPFEGHEAASRELALAEVHDCFTPTEIVLMEDLGLSRRGHAWQDVLDGVYHSSGAERDSKPHPLTTLSRCSAALPAGTMASSTLRMSSKL